MKKEKDIFEEFDKENEEYFQKCAKYDEQIKEERKDPSRYNLKKMSKKVRKYTDKKK